MSAIKPYHSQDRTEFDPGVGSEHVRPNEQVGPSEYWHFDALSDDGREAVIIRFYANYPFSPRYFKQRAGETSSLAENIRFPAISLTYSVNGDLVLHSINEFDSKEFISSEKTNTCTIGGSSFWVDRAEYGSGYMVRMDLATSSKRRIRAEFEWLSIDNTPSDEVFDGRTILGGWSMAAPRTDVSGRLTVIGKAGDVKKVAHFRGTGFHDHIRGGVLSEMTGPRCWGRAHFADSTAIFHHVGSADENASDILLVQNGTATKFAARCKVESMIRDRSGLKIPRRMTVVSGDDAELFVRPVQVVQSGFFEVQMLSEMTLKLKDGKHRSALGLVEFLDPGRMRNPFFRWFSDLRVGKNGKPPLF